MEITGEFLAPIIGAVMVELDINQATAYVIDTPERVSVSDMIIRPTKQEV